MKKIVFLIIGFLMFVYQGTAQEGPYLSSGIGVICPEKGINTRTLNFPQAPIELLDAAGGKKVGFIIKKNSLNIMYQLDGNGFPYRVADKDLAEMTPLGYCLKIFQREGDFVKVLVNSTGRGYWISLKELGYLRFNSICWIDWMKTQKVIFAPMVDVGINLRVSADAESRKIALLKGPLYGIVLTGNTEGSWAEATVSRYSTNPCKSSGLTPKAIETQSGWLKVIDDGGMPNIWYFPRGCN